MQTKFQLINYSLLCSVGVAIEYFDFIVFALLAPYISKNFFPQADYGIQLIETFMVFSLGYLVRPLSGILLGMLSDKFGRKKALLVSIGLMASATITIGITPNYYSIGSMATVILVICRLLQGVAHGAEMPIAITYISELDFKHKGLQCSLLYSAASIGAICSLTLCYLLEYNLSDVQILDWGWRVPFLLGGTLAFVGILLRYFAIESPVFAKLEEPKNTMFLSEVKTNYKSLFVAFTITLLVSCLVIMGLFLPTFLNKYLGISHEAAFRLTLIGMIYYTIILPIFGWIYTAYSRWSCYFITAYIIAISSIFIFNLLLSDSYFKILFFIIMLKTLLASLGASYPMMLTELFSNKFRNTGIAISYNLAFSIGACMPTFFLLSLEKLSGDLIILVSTFVLLAVLSILALLYEKKELKLLT